MKKYFQPDKSDTRYNDNIDKRCINCGLPGTDHYNGECPYDPEQECSSNCEDPFCPYIH